MKLLTFPYVVESKKAEPFELFKLDNNGVPFKIVKLDVGLGKPQYIFFCAKVDRGGWIFMDTDNTYWTDNIHINEHFDILEKADSDVLNRLLENNSFLEK